MIQAFATGRYEENLDFIHFLFYKYSDVYDFSSQFPRVLLEGKIQGKRAKGSQWRTHGRVSTTKNSKCGLKPQTFLLIDRRPFLEDGTG